MIGKIEFGPAFANNITAVPSSKLKEMQEEITRLHAELLTRQSELEVMSGELAACRKDAERYQWLAENCETGGSIFHQVPTLVHAIAHSDDWRTKLDEAINSAMAQEGDDDPDR